MKKESLESKKKDIVKKQIQKIQSVFDMSPEAVKKHPQLKKLQEYIESEDGNEKYVVDGGSSNPYVVYNPEYAVKVTCKPESPK